MRTRRGARRAAPLVLLAVGAVVGTGCSGGGSQHPAAAAATTAPVSAAPPGSPAAKLLNRAETVLATVHSYRFDAIQTVAAHTRVVTHLDGAVVRDQGVAYTLSVGRTRTQVVRVQGATYVRQLPGRWARLHKPRPVADPTASLTAILRGLTDVRTVGASTVVGTLSPAGEKAAGIPSGAPAQVTIGINNRGHVTQVTMDTAVKAGTKTVGVVLSTSYSGFDAVPMLRPPRS